MLHWSRAWEARLREAFLTLGSSWALPNAVPHWVYQVFPPRPCILMAVELNMTFTCDALASKC